jgi:hypothetical protein
MTSRPLVCARRISLLVLVCITFAAAPKSGQAFDGATLAAWHSTWHAPNALETPLRPYFIPRFPGRCDREAYSGEYEYVAFTNNAAVNEQLVDYSLPCETRDLPACPSCLSVRSERLGQIPNDLEVGGPVELAAPGR